MIKKHLSLLGHQCRDVVSGQTGVIDSICFDLYGCVQASVRPPLNDKGEHPQGMWFDVKRLKITSDVPVMAQPNFEQPEIGAADKPVRNV